MREVGREKGGGREGGAGARMERQAGPQAPSHMPQFELSFVWSGTHQPRSRTRGRRHPASLPSPPSPSHHSYHYRHHKNNPHRHYSQAAAHSSQGAGRAEGGAGACAAAHHVAPRHAQRAVEQRRRCAGPVRAPV